MTPILISRLKSKYYRLRWWLKGCPEHPPTDGSIQVHGAAGAKGLAKNSAPSWQDRPLVMLESPYAGDVEFNLAYARRCMADCISRGESPIASHLLYTQPGILDDRIPAQRRLGISMGLQWARAASKAVFYLDLDWSLGMIAARAFYLSHSIPIEERKIGWSKSDYQTLLIMETLDDTDRVKQTKI